MSLNIINPAWQPPLNKSIKETKDELWQRRGNHSTVLSIYCSVCKAPVLLYQKDGRPNQDLIRIYPDRIICPQVLKDLKLVKQEKDLEDLRCQNIIDGELCNNTLGTTMT